MTYDDDDRSGLGEPIGELALDAVARRERRALARGFRYGTPTILRLDGRYWCDALGFHVELSSLDPDADAMQALEETARRVDPAGSPEPAVAVALAVLQATEDERRTWIANADPSGRAAPTPPTGGDTHSPSRRGVPDARVAGSATEPGTPAGRAPTDHDGPPLQQPVARRAADVPRDVAARARAAIQDEFVSTITDRALLHHEVADVSTVASGFALLDPVASFRHGDARTVLVELRTAVAVVEWSGDTSRVWVAADDAHSVRAALWRLRRRLGDVQRTSADEMGGGLSADI
ncbi:hypothetical protein [Patulibacter sp.]|uniref:hypothetical protein n=1 Tax=Patulibacter sp. TaxID=1912859 RepID=UPI0027194BB4|nr:hypothetical protein [Patulibacter sp.]MDO9410103.1 hypothetical protein [Patulibacter sp.]